MIKIKKINLTAAQLIASFATPVKILDAPASGKVNVIFGATAKLNYGTVSFDNTPAGWIDFQPALAQGILLSLNIIDANQSNHRPFFMSQTESTIYTTNEDLYFQLSALPTVGDSNLDIFLIYEEKTTV